MDTSEGKSRSTYIHGMGNLVPGLEKALEGKGAGDSLEVTLSPRRGLRPPRREARSARCPCASCGDKNPKVGGRYRAKMDDGHRIVARATGHRAATTPRSTPTTPWRTRRLHFAVKVVEGPRGHDRRAAHGHVHGDGGHHH